MKERSTDTYLRNQPGVHGFGFNFWNVGKSGFKGGSQGKDCREYRLAKEKIFIPVTEAIVKSSAKLSDLN